MILTKEVLICDKDIFEGVSKNTNNPFRFNNLYVKENGLTQKLQVSERLYNKVEKGGKYLITVATNENGKLYYNDIEPIK